MYHALGNDSKTASCIVQLHSDVRICCCFSFLCRHRLTAYQVRQATNQPAHPSTRASEPTARQESSLDLRFGSLDTQHTRFRTAPCPSYGLPTHPSIHHHLFSPAPPKGVDRGSRAIHPVEQSNRRSCCAEHENGWILLPVVVLRLLLVLRFVSLYRQCTYVRTYLRLCLFSLSPRSGPRRGERHEEVADRQGAGRPAARLPGPGHAVQHTASTHTYFLAEEREVGTWFEYPWGLVPNPPPPISHLALAQRRYGFDAGGLYNVARCCWNPSRRWCVRADVGDRRA